MTKRKRRNRNNSDPLAEWREQMEHGHVPGYWASVARLPPTVNLRTATGFALMLVGGMLLVAGVVGIASRPEVLVGALGSIVLGAALLWVGIAMLRRRRGKRRSKAQ
jgi:hypothetical protein